MTRQKPPRERNKRNSSPKSWQWKCYSLNFGSETLLGDLRLTSFAKAQVTCCTGNDVERMGGRWNPLGRAVVESRMWTGDTVSTCFPIFPQDVKQRGRNFTYGQRLVLKISNIHAQTLEHEGKNMKHYKVHTALLFSQALGTRPCVVSPMVPLPTRRQRLPRRAGHRQTTLPRPTDHLPLAKKEPTRKKQVQDTIVIGSPMTFPNVLVRSPQTQ